MVSAECPVTQEVPGQGGPGGRGKGAGPAARRVSYSCLSGGGGKPVGVQPFAGHRGLRQAALLLSRLFLLI